MPGTAPGTSVWSRFLTHTDGHNKWYFVSVEPAIDGTGFVLMTAYGPIGSCHKVDTQMFTYSSAAIAISDAGTKVYEKERKGYRFAGAEPTFAMIARSDPKRLMKIIGRLASDAQAMRFLRTLFAGLTDTEMAELSPKDLMPLLKAEQRETRLAGMAMAAELASRRKTSGPTQ